MRDDHNRVYKSLSYVIEDKEGRVCETLLGKRVDYSGLSVIVMGLDVDCHKAEAYHLLALWLESIPLQRHNDSRVGISPPSELDMKVSPYLALVLPFFICCASLLCHSQFTLSEALAKKQAPFGVSDDMSRTYTSFLLVSLTSVGTEGVVCLDSLTMTVPETLSLEESCVSGFVCFMIPNPDLSFEE
ncbi:hypothetical protein Tco_0861110 [Tanacetum coccineum]|uniref:Uncharacterized protein n=1 Tax=Tanacetum coccineum TaxID=301880 RepID=A0ABQ5BJW1_9ASTR